MFQLEQRVKTKDGRKGIIKFIGPINGMTGTWVGIHSDNPDGKNDGKVKGIRYFTAPPQYGIFKKIEQIFEENIAIPSSNSKRRQTIAPNSRFQPSSTQKSFSKFSSVKKSTSKKKSGLSEQKVNQLPGSVLFPAKAPVETLNRRATLSVKSSSSSRFLSSHDRRKSIKPQKSVKISKINSKSPLAASSSISSIGQLPQSTQEYTSNDCSPLQSNQLCPNSKIMTQICQNLPDQQSKLHELQQLCDTLTLSLQEKTKLLESAEKKIIENTTLYKVEKSDLISQNSQLKVQVAHFESLSLEKISISNNLKNQVKDLTNQCEILKTEKENVDLKYNILETTNLEMKKTIVQLSSKIESIQIENEKIITDLKSCNFKLNTKINTLENDKKNLQASIDSYEIKNNKLSKDLTLIQSSTFSMTEDAISTPQKDQIVDLRDDTTLIQQYSDLQTKFEKISTKFHNAATLNQNLQNNLETSTKTQIILQKKLEESEELSNNQATTIHQLSLEIGVLKETLATMDSKSKETIDQQKSVYNLLETKLMREISDLQKEQSQMELSLRDGISTNRELSSQVTTLQSQVQDSQLENTQLSTDINSLKSQLKESQAQKSTLQSIIDLKSIETKSQIQSLKDILNSQTIENDQLKADLESIKEKYSVVVKRNKALKIKSDTLGQDLKNLSQNQKSSKSHQSNQFVELQEKYNQLESTTTNLKQTLSNSQVDFNQLQQKYNELNSENSFDKIQLKSKEQRICQLEEMLTVSNQSRTDTDIQNQLLKNNLSSQVMKNEEMSTELKNLQYSFTEKNNESIEMKKTIREYNETLSNLKYDNDQLIKKSSNLSNQLKNIKTKYDSVVSDHKTLQSNHLKLNEEIKSISKNMSITKKNLHNLETLYENLEIKHKNTLIEDSSIKDSYSQLKSEKDENEKSFKKQIQSLELDVLILKEQTEIDNLKLSTDNFKLKSQLETAQKLLQLNSKQDFTNLVSSAQLISTLQKLEKYILEQHQLYNIVVDYYFIKYGKENIDIIINTKEYDHLEQVEDNGPSPQPQQKNMKIIDTLETTVAFLENQLAESTFKIRALDQRIKSCQLDKEIAVENLEIQTILAQKQEKKYLEEIRKLKQAIAHPIPPCLAHIEKNQLYHTCMQLLQQLESHKKYHNIVVENYIEKFGIV